MTMNVSAALKSARSSALRDVIDAAGAAAKLTIYADPRPQPGAVTTAPVLAVITLRLPCGVVDSDGLHFAASASAQATGAGLATWARLCDGAGVWVFDVDCKQQGDARLAEIEIDIANFFPGAFVNLVSATFAEAG